LHNITIEETLSLYGIIFHNYGVLAIIIGEYRSESEIHDPHTDKNYEKNTDFFLKMFSK